MRRISPKNKLKAVREVLNKNKTLSEVSSKYKVSRQTLSIWVKKYQKDPKSGSRTLVNGYKRGRNHHKRLSYKLEKLVLDLVIQNPESGVHTIWKELAGRGFKVSLKGVYSVLLRYELQTKELRHRFSLEHPVKTIMAQALSPAYRAKIVEQYLKESAKISRVCKIWKISRPTFYSWLRRYKEGTEGLEDLEGTEGRIIESLRRLYKRGYEHHRAISQETREAILDLVRKRPDYSCHQLYAQLPRIEDRPIAGHHAVQNLLARENLNTQEKRRVFAQGYMVRPEVAPAPEYEMAARPAPSRWRFLFAPFATIPKFIIRTPFTWPLAIPLLIFLLYIFEVDKIFRPAIFFPIVSLTFGFLFFLYSLKYYYSLIIVLAYPGQSQKANRQKEADAGKLAKFLDWINVSKILAPVGEKPLAMQPNLDEVLLVRYPFVSIHLPLYNEKRVAERILRACREIDYPNFEVIIIDDSTDETTEIIKEFLGDRNGKLRETKGRDGEEVCEFIPNHSQSPAMTLIHRASRAGFKGAALSKALEYSDSRTEYVTVFDADFVPYPDTLEQFVKTFQVLAEGQTPINAESAPISAAPISADISENQRGSRIAAVQGYQWHVLNKSENWVTRGVRTEYAGSYVVERAGIELYGGLKMIAGSVFCIRADVLRKFGWGTSITEDLELTLKLYEAGYKVAFTPYIQAPAEAVSTVKRLIRQRMRWAEGHTFNVRKMWRRLWQTPNMSKREKFEFLYLGPYYLQAAFFIIGTFSWFVAEAVVHAQLPFWTVAWGWSLVFVNLLSLPLMNLVGLFLEESDERDYLGVASFVLLSYLLVPFQAYAAVKALFEKEEGPWFRTPKTGRITDVFGRARFYRWIERFRILPRPATQPVASFAHSLTLANISSNSRMDANGGRIDANERMGVLTPSLVPVSSFNPLSGYKFRPKRIPRVARATIAGLLVLVMSVNYLAFFPAPREAEAEGTPKLEQQINIIDQEYSVTSPGSFSPTDNSLGLVRFDTSKFSGTLTIYWEAILKVGNGSNTNIARLFRADGTGITGSGCQLTTSSTSYTRVRSTTNLTSCTDFTNNTDYSVRIICSPCTGSPGSVFIKAARIIVQQVGVLDESLVNTQTQIEVGDAQANPGAAYAALTRPKYYYYDTSKFNPQPTAKFEASLYSTSALSHIIQQEVNIIDQEYTTTSTTDAPTDNSLGLVNFDSADYSSDTVYFEGLISNSAGVWTSGQYTSLALDASGYPVISFYCSTSCPGDDATAGALRLVHCNDVNCSGGDENINIVDSTGATGLYTSLALDASGYPVISYYCGSACTGDDLYSGKLKLAHCGDANCTTATINTVDTTGATGQYTSLALDASGYPVISYYCSNIGGCPGDDATNGLLRLVHCNDANCDGTGETFNNIDTTGNLGSYSSLRLDTTSSTCTSTPKRCPVISYFDVTNQDLKLAHCNDNNCSGGDENINTVDSTGESTGLYTSLALDASGYPVISYQCIGSSCPNQDGTDGDLRLTHCGNANCSSGNSSNTVDSAGNTGQYTSLKLDSSGYPVIAYYCSSAACPGASALLRLVHCNDANCDGTGETFNNVDTSPSGPGLYTSLALDSSGYPVISYYDVSNADLKLAHCNDANCAAGGDNLNTVDGSSTTYLSLYTQAGSQLSGSEISTTSTSYTRVRSSAISPSATNYSVRLRASSQSGTTKVKAARLIIIQDENTTTATKTSIEVGNNTSKAGIGYAPITDKKIYYYDSSLFSPAPTFTFEATLKNSSTGNTFAALADSSSNCSSIVKEISMNGTTWTMASGGSFSLTSGTSYEVCLSAQNTGFIANARIVLVQSGTVTAFETMRMMVNTLATDTDSTYTSQNYLNRFDTQAASGWRGGKFDYFFEATIKTSAGTGYGQLYGSAAVSGSEVTSTSTSYERQASGSLKTSLFPGCELTSATNMDSQVKNNASNTTSVAGSWVKIQVSSLGQAIAMCAQLSAAGVVSGSRLYADPLASGTTAGTVRMESGTITLTNGQQYQVQIANGGVTPNGGIANAKIILDQSDNNGVSALETLQQYNNTRVSTTSTSYVSQNFPNQYTSDNFNAACGASGATCYFESTGTTSKTSEFAFVQMSDGLGEVSHGFTSLTRDRSASISPTTGEKDVQIHGSSGQTAYSNVSWLIIQLSGIPVPEFAILALPGMVFLPRIVRWVKKQRARRKKKVAGDRPFPTRMIANVKRIIANERIVPLIKRLSYD